jgi:glyceraldehyde-3-phosphate dehydrogenase/erythrose-4-phosphate dehydrogenase
MTNTQTVVDAPHKDLRRARAASLSLIPTTTGSATAIGLIFPELQGKLNGLAVRVPLLNASLTDCVFEVERPRRRHRCRAGRDHECRQRRPAAVRRARDFATDHAGIDHDGVGNDLR